MRRLLLASLAFAAASCGSSGRHGSAEPGPVAKQEAPVNPALALQTEVGFDPMAYRKADTSECLDHWASLQLPSLTKPWQLDGVFAEWGDVYPLLNDPLGDAPAAYDLTAAKVAVSGDDLVLAAAFRTPSGGSLNIELGGVSLVQGALRTDLRRLVRVIDGRLEQFQNGRWQVVGPEFGAVAGGPDGTEIWLSRRLLGDVVTWPLWWIRLFSRDENRDRMMDATAAAYLPSLLAVDQPPFVVDRCKAWPKRVGALEVNEIRAIRSVPLTTPESQAAAKLKQDQSAQIFALTRLALDRIGELLGAPLPINSLSVIVAEGERQALRLSTGSEPPYSNDDDPALHAGGGLAPLYRGLIFDLRRMAPEAADPYPEHEIYREAVAHILTLVLEQGFPTAPPLELVAVQQALSDALVVEQLGSSFWLDRFAAGVAPLLAASDAQAPLPLDVIGPEQAERRAKAVAFGHFLGSELTKAELFQTWREAAAATGGAASASGAFGKALSARCGGDQGRCSRLTALMAGWLNASSYQPQFAPAALGDSDLDGLPDYLERKIGTDPLRTDSDGDGWSDRAEFVAGTDPKSSASHPQALMPDGDFSDWQELLPKRLATVSTASGICPRAAAIQFYAALASPSQLMIGAVASDFWGSEPAARWEIALDLPKENRQFLVTSLAGSHEAVVFKPNQTEPFKRLVRAAPIAERSFELALDQRSLQVTTDFTGTDAIKIRLRTIYTNGTTNFLCSQTDWFVPFIPALPAATSP